ncbi:MAG: amidohydrolase family protein [Williamsia sp.]|nr:amidohydrolase family protein [Williamsia sp.]
MVRKITDTHIHIWDFDKARYAWLENDLSILNRNYELDELEEERLQAGITAGILVQSANNSEDTDWMLAVAAKTAWIRGVVGWLPLQNPEATARLLAEKYIQDPLFRGVRHLIHNEEDPAWLLQETVLESLALIASHGLTYDLVGTLPAHIETALTVARKIPGLRMVFDHLNQPPLVIRERFGRWGALMQEAAGYPHLWIKISGLGATAQKGEDWLAADIMPYVEFALNQFGADRCLCGGDWPVSLLAGSYARTWKIYREAIEGLLQPEEADKVFYLNAQYFYGL